MLLNNNSSGGMPDRGKQGRKQGAIASRLPSAYKHFYRYAQAPSVQVMSPRSQLRHARLSFPWRGGAT